MKRWPPTPFAIVVYIAIVATVAAVVGIGTAVRQGNDNTNRIDDIEVVQLRLCDAVTQIASAQNRNTEARLDLNDQFAGSPQVAASFGLTIEELKALTKKSTATDKKLVVDIQHAVELACR